MLGRYYEYDFQTGESSGAGAGAEGSGEVTMSAFVGNQAERITTAVVEIAKKVEKHLPSVLTTTASASPTTSPPTAPGAAIIKQVRSAAGKILAAKSVASPTLPLRQPHIEVAVQGGEKSKWEGGKPAPTKGHVMVDTGAAVTLVTAAWARAHGLKVNEDDKDAVEISGAAG